MAGLRRSLHFVPGGNERMFEKSLSLAADALILDLEDAVAAEAKPEARAIVRRWLDDADFGARERIVRANPLDSPWGRADVEALLDGTPPDALLVPKVRGAGEIVELDALLTELERTAAPGRAPVELVIVATETPQAVFALQDIASAPRVSAMTWGAEDLSAAIGARRNRDDAGAYLPVFAHCRTLTLLAASAAGVAPIDGVYVDFRDPEGLAAECREAADSGFQGKMTIHPSQIETANACFSPHGDVVAAARELLDAWAEHEREGRGAFAFRGEMVDAPHIARAERLLERASAIGAAIDGKTDANP